VEPCAPSSVPYRLCRTGAVRVSAIPISKFRTNRLKLKDRRESYWQRIGPGCQLGFRRLKEGAGTWIAKRRSEGGDRAYEALGAADDYQVANGVDVLSFAQAQEKARAFFTRKHARPPAASCRPAPIRSPMSYKTLSLDPFKPRLVGLASDSRRRLCDGVMPISDLLLCQLVDRDRAELGNDARIGVTQPACSRKAACVNLIRCTPSAIRQPTPMR
jgi:hypothetical protein